MSKMLLCTSHLSLPYRHAASSSEVLPSEFSQEAQTDEILKLAFDTSVDQEIPNRLKAHTEVIAFYQSVAIMQMKPSYSTQCIRAVSIVSLID